MKPLVVGLLVVILLNQQIPTTPLLDQEIFDFKKIEGSNFNGTTASFFGMGNDQLKVLVVAGTDKDDIGLQIYLSQKMTDFAITNGSVTRDKPSEIITLINYPEAYVIDQSLNNKSVSFTNLNWTITHTEGLFSSDYGELVVNASTTLNGSQFADLEGLRISIEYQFTLNVTQGSLSIPLYLLDGNTTTTNGTLTREGWFAQFGVKINHAYHHTNLTAYKYVAQPFNLRYIYRTIVPKAFSRPQQDLNTSESEPNNIRIHLSNTFRSNYEWNQTVVVDGQPESVIVRNLNSYTRFKHTELENSKIVTFSYFGSKYFAYPTGNSVIHDPVFGSVSFIQFPPGNTTSFTTTPNSTPSSGSTPDTTGNSAPITPSTKQPINFDVDLQFNTQFVALITITAIFLITFIYHRKSR